mgnify:CR=1 FL=1
MIPMFVKWKDCRLFQEPTGCCAGMVRESGWKIWASSIRETQRKGVKKVQKSKFLNRLNANEYALYGEIVADAGYKWSGDDVCPSDVLDMLEEAGGNDILLHVNSPGGDVFSGFAIYNQLQSYFEQLELDGILERNTSEVGIDIEAQRVFQQRRNVDRYPKDRRKSVPPQ